MCTLTWKKCSCSGKVLKDEKNSDIIGWNCFPEGLYSIGTFNLGQWISLSLSLSLSLSPPCARAARLSQRITNRLILRNSGHKSLDFEKRKPSSFGVGKFERIIWSGENSASLYIYDLYY